MWVQLCQAGAVDTLVLDAIHIAMYWHYRCQLLHYCYWHQCIELNDSVVVEEHNLTESLPELMG
jgi:hypothetical protein